MARRGKRRGKSNKFLPLSISLIRKHQLNQLLNVFPSNTTNFDHTARLFPPSQNYIYTYKKFSPTQKNSRQKKYKTKKNFYKLFHILFTHKNHYQEIVEMPKKDYRYYLGSAKTKITLGKKNLKKKIQREKFHREWRRCRLYFVRC